jgi:hypothetical protein
VDLSSISGTMQPADLGMSTGEDAGFLESLEGSIWWAQLDSWVCVFLQSQWYSWLTLLPPGLVQSP